MNRSMLASVLVIFLLGTSQAFAIEARDTVALPSNTVLMVLYYDHAFGNEYYSKYKKESDSQNLTQNVSILRTVYYKEFFGHIFATHLIIPFGGVQLNDDQSNGIGDITPVESIWLVDDKVNKFAISTSTYITIPTGQYRRESSINIGSNRWAFKQELAFNKWLGDKFLLELIGYAQFFTDNTNALNSSSQRATLSKDPLFDIEFHASYNFTKEFWASADYYFNIGGEETLDGVRQNNRTNTHTVGVELAYMLTNQMQIMLNYKMPVSVENGIKANEFMARLSYAF